VKWGPPAADQLHSANSTNSELAGALSARKTESAHGIDRLIAWSNVCGTLKKARVKMRLKFNEWMMGTIILVLYLTVVALSGRHLGWGEVLYGVTVAFLLVIFMKIVAWRSTRGR
jgi:hypothetical protein